MSDIEKYDNVYASLSQATYDGRKLQFAYDPQKWENNQLEYYRQSNSVPFTFPHAKDAYGNDASKVYLQPDKLETVTEKDCFGNEKISQKNCIGEKACRKKE